ncbi:MAG: FeoB small GTPase domain-containing protein [Caldilineaceae bacterium]
MITLPLRQDPIVSPHETRTHRIALAGNPNVGKSTIFNELTGSNQHVGNWPGKTVARRTGWYEFDGKRFEVVDLPGIYSLSPYSPDEEVARDYIVQSRPDLVVNVVDVTNLERNLYLTVQILETEAPLLVVLNMQDLASQRGVRVDAAKLSQLLAGAPVIAAAAARGRGLADLLSAIRDRTSSCEPNAFGLVEQCEHGGQGVFCHCSH